MINRQSAIENLACRAHDSTEPCLSGRQVVEVRTGRRQAGRKLKAFTLVELLVVVAIISLLVSILLPSLNQAKELARRVVCACNMKGIGLAFTMYTNDWKNWFPLVRDQGPTNLSGVWADKLYDGYAEDVKVFHCPSAPNRIFTPNETNGVWLMAYGMEWWLGGGMDIDNTPEKPNGVGHRVTDASQSADTVLLGENRDTFGTHGYGVHNFDWPDPTDSWGWPDDNRHAGMSNILFVDAHVAPYVADDALDTEGNLVWFR